MNTYHLHNRPLPPPLHPFYAAAFGKNWWNICRACVRWSQSVNNFFEFRFMKAASKLMFTYTKPNFNFLIKNLSTLINNNDKRVAHIFNKKSDFTVFIHLRNKTVIDPFSIQNSKIYDNFIKNEVWK